MRGLISKISLLIFAGLPLCLVAQDFNPSLLRMQAQYNRGDFEAVANDYQFVPEEDGGRGLFYLLKGRAAYQLGDITGSIEYLKNAEQSSPGMAALDLAHSYKLAGDKQQLFFYLEKHLKSEYKLPRKEIMLDTVFADLDRDRDWIRFWSGNWYDEQDNTIALAEYKISSKDNDFNFWSDLIDNHQDNPVMLALAGQYYKLAKDNRKAGLYFEKAIGLDPDNSMVLLKYGNFLLENNNFAEAIAVYRKLSENNPYEIKYYLLHVMALIRSGEAGMALDEIRRLEQAGIDSSGLNLLLATELIGNDTPLAIEYLSPLIDSSPSSEAFNLRAKAYKETGNINEAISDYAMSLDIDPKQPEVYFNRAHLRLSIGDREGACYDWSMALNLGHRKAADMLYKYCK